MDATKEYFQYAKDKVYLRQYPKQIISLDELRGKRILDVGAGRGNDLVYLMESGFSPADLFYLDLDPETHAFAKENLVRKGFSERNILLADAKDTGLNNSSFDVVYANNFVHCLGDITEMQKFFKEAYRILDEQGIVLGRTLFNEIYMDKVERLKGNDFHRYTAHLMELGQLVGLEPSNLESFAKPAGFVDFKNSLEEISNMPIRNFYFRAEKR